MLSAVLVDNIDARKPTGNGWTRVENQGNCGIILGRRVDRCMEEYPTCVANRTTSNHRPLGLAPRGNVTLMPTTCPPFCADRKGSFAKASLRDWQESAEESDLTRTSYPAQHLAGQ